MTWKYELETRGRHCIVRETNARFRLRDAILTCNFVMVLLGPLRIVSGQLPSATGLTFQPHSIRSSQMPVFAPVHRNPQTEMPPIRSEP
jgi:hypothetical protein